jgi:hypothetical protein
MSAQETIQSSLDRLPLEPAAVQPQFGMLLMHMDNENDLRKQARALAIADHAAFVDADQRTTEYSWHIARSAILVKAQAFDPVLQKWQPRSPDWWAACWRASYCDTRDALNAGEIPSIALRDLDNEYREELAAEAHERATGGEFADFDVPVTVSRGGPAADEPDPFDQF